VVGQRLVQLVKRASLSPKASRSWKTEATRVIAFVRGRENTP